MQDKSPAFKLSDYETFVYSLLCKRKRRQRLILHLNSHLPFKGDCLQTVFRKFIECILYSPLRFCISNNSISFFGQKLPILKTYLTSGELDIVNTIFLQKDRLFSSVKSAETRYLLNGYKYDKCKRPIFSMQHRREFARDFVYFVTSRNATFRRHVMLNVCQSIIAQKQYETDPFIFRLHYLLQQPDNSNLNRLIVTE